MMNKEMDLKVLNNKELKQVNGGGFCFLFGFGNNQSLCFIKGMDMDVKREDDTHYGIGVEGCHYVGAGFDISY